MKTDSLNSDMHYSAPTFLSSEQFTGIDHSRKTISIRLEEITEIPFSCYFDLVPPTMEGLFEDLIPGSDMKNELLKEWELFQEHQDEPNCYGTLVWYPRTKELVRFAPQFWHRLSLLVRNKTLYQDPEMKLSWEEVRKLFEEAVIAVAGCSLGNNVAHTIAWDLRPLSMKIGDFKEFHMANGNRVRLTYRDFGRNKTAVTAEQLQSVDPFLSISLFPEGIHEENIDNFIVGSTVIVEEIDDLETKILIREAARKHKVPVVMASDIGTAVQLDVRRFDKDQSISLMGCGVSDEQLYAALHRWRTTGKEEDFMNVFFAIVGTHCMRIPEFKQLMMRGLSSEMKNSAPLVKEVAPVFKGLPQLGSTAAMSGALATDAVARILLGFRLQERIFIDKRDGFSATEGVLL